MASCCGKPDTDMLNLVLGYKTREPSAKPEVLYVGTDGSEAREKLNNPGPGILRSVLSFPEPHKYRYFQSPEELARAEEAKAEAERKAFGDGSDGKDAGEKSEKSPTKKQEKKSSH